MRTSIIRGTIAAALLCSSVAAQAIVLPFTGTLSGFGFAGPDPSCAPFPFGGSATAGGSSSLGGFSYSHDICLFGATGPSEGTFLIEFGPDSISGTMSGGATETDIPNLSDLSWTYTILDGTGQFLGATGVFTGIGTSDRRDGPPTKLSLSLVGSIDAPAAPEPGTWATMLLGFGAVGALLRRGRNHGRKLVQLA